MTQKERLVELIHSCPANKVFMFDSNFDYRESLADYLLSNGVIVPPCKVGDVVYSIWKFDGKVQREKVQYFTYDSEDQWFWFGTDAPNMFTSEHIGERVFFTRKEAEQALKERGTE